MAAAAYVRPLALLVFLLAISEGNLALRCFCNDTLAIPTARCFHHLACEVTNGVCYAQITRIQTPKISPPIVRMQWGCMQIQTGPGYQAELIIHGFCGGGMDNTSNIVKCCNDTDMCNKDIHLVLPTPTMDVLPGSVTGSNVAQKHSNSPSHHSDSAPLSILMIVSIVVGISALLVLLVVFLTIVLLLRRKRRNIPGIMYRGRGRNGSDSAPLELSEQTCMTMLDSSVGAIPTTLSQRTIARSILLQNPIGSRDGAQVYLGKYGGNSVAVRRYSLPLKHHWLTEVHVFNLPLLQDENVVGFAGSDVVTNVGVTEYWLVTQHHSLGSLCDYLQNSIVSPRHMLNMAESICSGLAHLHSEVFSTQAKPAVALRSITSRNILVKENFTCCLSDFHLTVVKEMGNSVVDSPINLYEGCVRYMAPEIFNETINVRYFGSFKQTDVYALGLVLWELCRRCAGPAEPYELPFYGLVPPVPSFNDMRRVVAVEKRQPTIPDRWLKDKLLREMAKMMRECWYFNSSARLTAAYLKKKLLRMIQADKLPTNVSLRL